MQRNLAAEPAESVLAMLSDALELVDFGIVLLDSDLRARFINRGFVKMWSIPEAVLATGPSFRDLLDHVASIRLYPVPASEMTRYVDDREAEVRGGYVEPTVLETTDDRHLLFRCVPAANGGRILTYADISRQMQHEAAEAAKKTHAEMRFNTELLEEQGANLATLAEAAEASAQRALAAQFLLEHEISERRQLEVSLRRLATTDGLTGVLNRAAFLASAQQEIDARQASVTKMVMLMIDVDHFKEINDRFGHAGGDCALQFLVTTLRAGIRQSDLLGRLGGEEFAILLVDAPKEAAEMIAGRLRMATQDARITFADRTIQMTVSIGLAVQFDTDRSVDQVLARADDALYRAKAGGRNRVVADQQSEAA